MKDKAVFVIEIYEQKHGTWQGRLTGIGNDKTEKHSFRSALEMIKMIDEGLSSQNDRDKDDDSDKDEKS